MQLKIWIDDNNYVTFDVALESGSNDQLASGPDVRTAPIVFPLSLVMYFAM